MKDGHAQVINYKVEYIRENYSFKDNSTAYVHYEGIVDTYLIVVLGEDASDITLTTVRRATGYLKSELCGLDQRINYKSMSQSTRSTKTIWSKSF